jgi:hypothetical protein
MAAILTKRGGPLHGAKTQGLPLQRDGCPFRIDTSTQPMGLTIHPSKIPLSNFFQLGTTVQLKAPGATLYPPLVDAYDGSGVAYYCHNKKWYVAPLD